MSILARVGRASAVAGAACVASCLLPAFAHAQKPSEVQKGRAEFLEHNCYGCHGGLAGGGMGPSLRDAKWGHGGSVDSITNSVLHGFPHHGMPDWEKKGMHRDEAHAIALYLRSLRTADEPTFFFHWKQQLGEEEGGKKEKSAPHT